MGGVVSACHYGIYPPRWVPSAGGVAPPSPGGVNAKMAAGGPGAPQTRNRPIRMLYGDTKAPLMPPHDHHGSPLYPRRVC